MVVEEAITAAAERKKGDDRSLDQIVTSALRGLARQKFKLRPTVHTHILQASEKEVRA